MRSFLLVRPIRFQNALEDSQSLLGQLLGIPPQRVDEQHRAFKLHTHFELLKGVPVGVDLTEASIEERILATLSLKRALFDGLFDGTATEVDFRKLGKEKFMDQVAKLTELKGIDHQPHLPGTPPPAAPDDDRSRVAEETDLLTAGVNFLEALTRTLVAGGNDDGSGNGKSPTRRTTRARQAARELGAGQALEKALADRAATWVRQDDRTGRTTLQIPVPSDEVVKRGARVLGQALGALLERFGGTGC